MPTVYLVYKSDGWGHKFLLRISSTYALACAWVGENGGDKEDAARAAGYPQKPEVPGEYLIKSEKGNGFFQVEWYPVDAPLS